MVEYNEVTGHPNVIWDKLNRKVNGYKGKNKKIKIGITGRNPQKRFYEHLQTYQWKRMVVIYKTSSVNYANTIEKWLVEYHSEHVENLKNGGGSYHLPNEGPNYVYILIA